MYFLHSYYCKVNAKYELSKTNYGNLNFTSSVKVKNSYGVQFHPEKSGKKGIEIFKNFLNLKYEKNIKN
jgi:glutamine amidotransferase